MTARWGLPHERRPIPRDHPAATPDQTRRGRVAVPTFASGRVWLALTVAWSAFVAGHQFWL